MDVTVRVAPVPDIVTFPGVRVRFHVPASGSPLRATLPVERAHVGCVIAPTTGAVGVAGWAFMTTLDEAAEMHPRALVTVKLYVPWASPEMVVLDPEPVVVCPPGERVIVQSPDGGRLFRTTLPVGRAHVGWVIVPGTGATGLAFTVSDYVAVAAAHGVPRGLFVVTVIKTTLPASPATGV